MGVIYQNYRANKRQIGAKYEQIASDYLEGKGYEILEQNYYCKKGEIDLIARQGDYLVFVEVKYRKNQKNGYGMEAITVRKQKRIKQSALFYLMERQLSMEQPMRFDVVSIDGDKISLIPNAFPYYC